MTTTPAPRVLSGRYELAHLVARGGMAEVYRAHDRLLDRPVALKILFPELSVDRSFVERFRREAQAAANLSHPNIVPVFDWGEDGGTYFIVMEFIDGRALSPILRTAGPLHPDRAAEIAADVAGALAYAHRHGVIHRDVKPGNVLITEEGIVKVTDFGIARAVNTEESLTQTGAVMGTATYFSPEQAEGIGVDARSDIYSLGVVLFEMVTGRPPFLGDTPVAVASKHVREHPPTAREINPAVPPDLEAIISKCMSKSPDNRYSTGDDLRADLLRFREGRSVTATATGQNPSVGATSTIAQVGHTQAVPQVMPIDYGEEERSRTGLYATILVLLLVALAVVIVFLGQSLGWWHFGKPDNTFAMPDVSGQTLAQAQRTLQADGLKTTQRSDSSSTAPNTQVLRTTPASGVTVHKGQSIVIVTGSRGNTVMVPNVVNDSVTEAKSAITAQGLQANVEMSATCTMLNVVCNQTPAAGLPEPPGTIINLFTAATTTTTTPEASVPNVTGDTVGQACSKLGNAGFSCGTQNPVSSSFTPGTVVSTMPTSGTAEPPGTTVTLNVSSGPSQVFVPDVLGDPENTAVSTLQGDNLTPVVSCQQTGGDSVVAQNPQGGAQVMSGTDVTITVSMTSCPGGTTTTPTTS